MLYEERLEAAERRRLEGNELFKAGQCRDALGKYAISVQTMMCIEQHVGPHQALLHLVTSGISGLLRPWAALLLGELHCFAS